METGYRFKQGSTGPSQGAFGIDQALLSLIAARTFHLKGHSNLSVFPVEIVESIAAPLRIAR